MSRVVPANVRTNVVIGAPMGSVILMRAFPVSEK